MSVRPPAGPRTGAARGIVVVVAVLALLALTSAGIAAAGRVSLSSAPLLRGAASTQLIATLFALLVGVVVAALVLQAFYGVGRDPRGRAVRRRLDPLTVVVGVVLALLLWVVLRNGLVDPPALPRRPDPAAAEPAAGEASTRGESSWTWTTTGAVLALVLAAGAALVWWRARLASMAAASADSGEHAEPDAAGLAAVDQAVRAGQAALSAATEPRAAVVACYAAMEAQLASSGTARGHAETPEELLARTSAAGLVSPGPAATLTRLFGEARFSSHPLGHGERAAAEEALARITSDLAARVSDRVSGRAAGAPGSGYST